jgi:hypothetical protein
MPSDFCSNCPACSNQADKDGKAPLIPGLTKTDERSPLFMVCGDGNAKATRFANAGRAQNGVEPVCNTYFGTANERFAAELSGPARAEAVATGPQDRACGSSHLRCVKTTNVKGGLFSEYGVTLCNCSHGIPLSGSGIDCVVHGACARHEYALAQHGGWLNLRMRRVASPENMRMYDLTLDELRKQRNLKIWVLDNNCLYAKHVLAANPNEDLLMYIPTWHALNHNYVRSAAAAPRRPLTRCASARSPARRKTARCTSHWPRCGTANVANARGPGWRQSGLCFGPAQRCGCLCAPC